MNIPEKKIKKLLLTTFIAAIHLKVAIESKKNHPWFQIDLCFDFKEHGKLLCGSISDQFCCTVE